MVPPILLVLHDQHGALAYFATPAQLAAHIAGIDPRFRHHLRVAHYALAFTELEPVELNGGERQAGSRRIGVISSSAD